MLNQKRELRALVEDNQDNGWCGGGGSQVLSIVQFVDICMGRSLSGSLGLLHCKYLDIECGRCLGGT